MEIFNVKLELTNESNCMILRKNSQEENEPEYENESMNVKNSEEIESPLCLKRNHSSIKKSFNLTESQKKLLIKFNSIVQRFSIKKKIPLNLEKKIYELIDDKSYFLRTKKIEIRGSISYFIKKFKSVLFINENFKNFINHHSFIIHPYENFKIFWDLIHFFIMILLFFILPLDIIFEFDDFKPIRLFMSVFLIFDNFLGFSTAYFLNGKLITDRNKIFHSYINNFILDLFTQISLIYDIFLVGNETDIQRKFIKLICLLQYRKFKHIYHTLIDRFKIDMKFGFFLDFVNLIAQIICMMHWVACVWYLIGNVSEEPNVWLDIQNLKDKSEFDKYIYSFYWSAVTMMTVGYGDFTPQNRIETIFCTLIVVVGCGMFAYYIKYYIYKKIHIKVLIYELIMILINMIVLVMYSELTKIYY